MPFPQIATQAVKFVCWSFLIFGAFAVQPLTDEEVDDADGNSQIDTTSTGFWIYLEVARLKIISFI
jgi:hypothetical protein